MPLRIQLLLVSLLVLVLPWAGCQYVREMESALRQGQEDALLGSARAIASVLQNRPALFDRARETPGLGDAPVIYAHPLSASVRIDGYVDDWNIDPRALLPIDPGTDAIYAAGVDDRYLYLYLDVQDQDVVYASGEDTVSGDRLVFSFVTPAGTRRDLLFLTTAPGPVLARMLVRGDETAGNLPREQRALANWQETNTGYHVELRVPLSSIGAQIGFELTDVDAETSATHGQTGRLVHPLSLLDGLLDEFEQPGLTLRVTDADGWVLGASNAMRLFAAEQSTAASMGLLDRLYLALLDTRAPDAREITDTPGRIAGAHIASALAGDAGAAWYRTDERAVIAAAEPVRAEGRVIGAVVLEQGSDRILTLTNAALTRLLNLTLLATLLAAAGLLAYATWLSLRIRRLRDAAESAIGPDGRITRSIPGVRAKDELGDLSRSFTGMLGRLDEYTRYLRSLASKLSHELRTPLAVVSTSLENLEHHALPSDAKPLADRAMQGTQRLARIVAAMSAATRIEQSIEGAEPERFDLAALVGGSVGGYRGAFPQRRFELALPEEPCPLEGVPDLLSQMLDKLVDNAVDFSAAGGLIHIGLRREREAYRLEVFNAGGPLPEDMQAQLFDSLVSVRESAGETPHLGLGLYIARLIAQFHGGTIAARNVERGPEGASGVNFDVSLPAR
ncbi:MAG: proteobacterial dedicated sortase system histidine kinase [Gammaproteobacteria bacterium]